MASPAAAERMWRPAAQRNLRNTWSSIAAACSSWSATSTKGLTAATALVNAYLSRGYLGSTNFGVLNEMEGLRAKAQKKLHDQQMTHLDNIIDAYEELVDVTSRLVQEAKSMRIYLRDSGGGSLVSFSKDRVFEHDTGDGHGLPVFSTLTINCFEELAELIVKMYLMELRAKWLLASEFTSIVHCESKTLPAEKLQRLQCAVLCQSPCFSDSSQCVHNNLLPSRSRKEYKRQLKREVLEVYLASWLAEVNLRKQKVDEILALVSQEIQAHLA